MFKVGDLVTHSDHSDNINFIITHVFFEGGSHCKKFAYENSYIYSMSSENLRHICEKKQGIFDMFKDYM